MFIRRVKIVSGKNKQTKFPQLPQQNRKSFIGRLRVSILAKLQPHVTGSPSLLALSGRDLFSLLCASVSWGMWKRAAGRKASKKEKTSEKAS